MRRDGCSNAAGAGQGTWRTFGRQGMLVPCSRAAAVVYMHICMDVLLQAAGVHERRSRTRRTRATSAPCLRSPPCPASAMCPLASSGTSEAKQGALVVCLARTHAPCELRQHARGKQACYAVQRDMCEGCMLGLSRVHTLPACCMLAYSLLFSSRVCCVH